MEERLWMTFVFLFSLGGICVWYLSKGGAQGSKDIMRGKYLVYLFISLLMFLISIYSNIYFMICLVICLLGLIEIYKLALPNRIKYLSIILFLILSLFFIYFSYISALYDGTLLLCLVLALDGFGQILGKIFGKNSIAKSISPNKTWEGFLGGYFCVVIGYLFIRQMDVSLVGFFMITMLVVAALSGDLLASYLKRKAKVKDFNGLIPFHGGVLDRFDSLIFASAVAAPFYMMGFKV